MASFADTVKAQLRRWTYDLGGPELRDRLSKLTPPSNEFGVDPYGFDLDFVVSALAPFIWLYKNYFHVSVHGIENVPADGRVLLVPNHSGQLPLDGAMIACSLVMERDPPRAVRTMVEKWIPTLPFVSTFMARMGQIVGTPENCRRLLAAGEAILSFPEGVRGLNKLYKDRYQLQEFGLGFMRLALETDTPIIPVGVVGAEDQAPALFDIKPLAKLLTWPAFPVTPVPFPLPARYQIYFGKPLRFVGAPDEEDAELEIKVAKVKEAIRGLLKEGLSKRTRVYF